MSNPVASVEIQARTGGLDAALRSARAKFHRFADGVAEDYAKSGKKTGDGFFGGKKRDRSGPGMLGNATSTAVGQLGAQAVSRVTSTIEDSARSVYRFEDSLVRLGIQAEQTPEAMAAFGDSVRRASNATGIDAEKVLGAANAYVTLTGDMRTATASTATWARVAQATNSSVDDIAKTAAAMTQNLRVTPAEMEEVFSTLAIQGKKGAIELKDLASEMSSIAPVWAQFGKGTGATGVRELGAALQVVKRGFGGDAGETVTGLNAFLIATSKFSGRFKAAGAGDFMKTGKNGQRDLKSVFEIIDMIGKSKLAKDPELLRKAFGRDEAYRAYLQLKENRGALDELVASSQDATVIQRDFDTYMNSTAGKLSQSFERLKNTVAEVFTPSRITAFASALMKVADLMGSIVGFIEKAGAQAARLAGDDSAYVAMESDDQSAKEIAAAQGLSKDEKRNRARGLLQYYANEANTDTPGGFAGTRKEISQESARKAGFALMEQSSPFYSQPMAEFKSSLSDPKANKLEAEIMRRNFDASLVEVRKQTDLLSKLLGVAQSGTTVEVGGDAVAKAAKGASAHRRDVAK